MFFTSPISSSIRNTASFAPPCSGPYSAATPAATAEYGSTCDEPTARTAFVEQFCSWSAWRMNSTSIARAKTGCASYLGSDIRAIIDKKLSAYGSELSGYTYGRPFTCRYAKAARVGILASMRMNVMSRSRSSWMSFDVG